jgi:uncharacterized radical SAM superfamily Fe-S cluster-containing enzyme
MKSLFAPKPASIQVEGDLPDRTLTGEPVAPITTSLPRTVLSICPQCHAPIPAEKYAEGGRVLMRKSCPSHGTFNDVVFSDAELFLSLEKWHFGDGRGFANPSGESQGNCPARCGICGRHTAHTSLANIELTGRCNLSCNICFADANRHAHELPFEQALEALRRLREQSPAPAFAVQFTGGEPTIHPRFLDIVAAARKEGFSHIQVASNGLAFADPDYAMRAREAGLQYIYLQMDGTSDDVFLKIRGRELLAAKLAVIESARKAGLRVIFVPTIAKGVNDHQIGDIFRLAFDNLDVLSGISFQPMTFAGRYPEGERLRLRFTLSDIAREFSAQTGVTHPRDDWFPLSAAVPLVRYGGTLTGSTPVNHACHPHCGLMTLLFVGPDRSAVPVTRFLDLYNLLREIDGLAARTRGHGSMVLSKIRALHALNRFFHADRAPEGLSFLRFLQTLDGFADRQYSWDERYRGYTYKSFFVLGMHFMDAFNYDIERVSRCGVHYAAPDGRTYPFCTYNAGPTYRNRVQELITPRRER